jgi:hypothetical protein
MSVPRQLPLFDSVVTHSSWNERMVPGEFAVHYSSFAPNTTPFCTIFPDLFTAEAYAQQQVLIRPTLRCSIYDAQGFIGPPLRDVRGAEYKHGEMSARFRRWAAAILFFGGGGLLTLDWANNFALDWPSLIGTRMLIPGLILAVMEIGLTVHAHIEQRRAAEKIL